MTGISGIKYSSEITAAANAHGIDPKLLAAVAAQETGGPGSSSGNNIVGDGGHGHGVFQIDDRTWAFASTPAAMDPAANAGQAASILAGDLSRYGGDVKAALSAYNSGSPTAAGTQTTWPDGQTLGYADSVMRHYAQLDGNTQAQLVADSRETSAEVGALAALGAAQAPGSTVPQSLGVPAALAPTEPGSSASSAGTAESTAAMSGLLSTLANAATPPPQQPATNTATAQQASQIGARADDDMAGLVDGGSLFGDDPSDDDSL
jgi:soluble lytic murein transglycosylase-like protein